MSTAERLMTQPEKLQRRSHLYRTCREAGAHWRVVNGFGAPAHYGDVSGETAAAARLAIADLTALPRAGYKGWGMADWIRDQGVSLPEPNQVRRQEDGTLACRLSSGELLLLADDDEATLIDRLEGAWSMDDAVCFPVPRADASARLVVTGHESAAMMAKMCGVDLRGHRFSDHAIAQTSVARMNVIVLRNDRGAAPAYDLIFDSASAVYLWGCLVDAMAEFSGRIVGLDAIDALRG